MIRYVMSISTCTHISHPSPSIRLLILKREDLSFSYWNVILEGMCTCTLYISKKYIIIYNYI